MPLLTPQNLKYSMLLFVPHKIAIILTNLLLFHLCLLFVPHRQQCKESKVGNRKIIPKSISLNFANGCDEFPYTTLLTTQKKSQISQEDYAQ
jgi:hypothetical protein